MTTRRVLCPITSNPNGRPYKCRNEPKKEVVLTTPKGELDIKVLVCAKHAALLGDLAEYRA